MKQMPLLALLMALFVVSCGEPKIEPSSSGNTENKSEEPAAKTNAGERKVRREPDHITVDHILVGVTHPKLAVKRSIAEPISATRLGISAAGIPCPVPNLIASTAVSLAVVGFDEPAASILSLASSSAIPTESLMTPMRSLS